MSSWLRPRNTVLAILLLLLAGELGVRVLIDHDSAWNTRLGTAKRFDPVTLFRLKANHEVAPGVRTNERGYLAHHWSWPRTRGSNLSSRVANV